MMSDLPAILITGFGPFPGVDLNHSGVLSTECAKAVRAAYANVEVINTVLETEWARAPEQVDALVQQHKPVVAVHFGVSAHATGFEIETIARNVCERVDAAGCTPQSGHICPGGPAERMSTLPMHAIATRLREQKLPVRLSDDAGAYLCNAVLYRSLQAQEQNQRGGQSGFIHLPTQFLSEQPSRENTGSLLDQTDALLGCMTIAQTCLDLALSPPHNVAPPPGMIHARPVGEVAGETPKSILSCRAK